MIKTVRRIDLGRMVGRKLEADFADSTVCALVTPPTWQRIGRAALGRLLEEIATALQSGHRIELRGFGMFYMRARRARLGTIPNAWKPGRRPEDRAVRYRIPPTLRAVWKPAKQMRSLTVVLPEEQQP